MITNLDLVALVEAASIAGHQVNIDDLQVLQWDAGIATHVRLKLPQNCAAVYVFKWKDEYLKVGKVNANSNARYQSQHYNPNSSNSNLSKTLLGRSDFNEILGEALPGDWLVANTTRFNIIIPSHLGKNFVHFAEAFFILRCKPKFENTRA